MDRTQLWYSLNLVVVLYWADFQILLSICKGFWPCWVSLWYHCLHLHRDWQCCQGRWNVLLWVGLFRLLVMVRGLGCLASSALFSSGLSLDRLALQRCLDERFSLTCVGLCERTKPRHLQSQDFPDVRTSPSVHLMAPRFIFGGLSYHPVRKRL